MMSEPIVSETPEDENTTLTANALKAMAHPLRWKILCSLGDKELSVGEIVDRTGTSQSNISQHLEQLRNKNIVVTGATSGIGRAATGQLLDLGAEVLVVGRDEQRTIRAAAERALAAGRPGRSARRLRSLAGDVRDRLFVD